MKKIILFTFLCALTSLCFAFQDAYGNRAGATYIGKANSLNINGILKSRRADMMMDGDVYEVGKLTRLESQLVGSALNEYDANVGDVYGITLGIFLSQNSIKLMNILVRIDSVNGNYTWWSVGMRYVYF